MTTASPPPRPYGLAPSGYRLPAATRIGRVRLQVTDLDRSIGYYETVLGLRVLHRAAGLATLGAQAADAPLIELCEKRDVRPIPRGGHIGLYHFAMLLPDRASLGQFIAHLGVVGVYAGMSDHLVSESVYLQDPDGLGIEVYADRLRSAWRWDARQLAMTTAALDIGELIALANGEEWSGAPAGTTIGHVHLNVRDIPAAEAFYHQALGFDKVVWGYPGALFMSAGGYHHHLGVNTWSAAAPLPTDEDARLIEWELVIPSADIDAAVKSLSSAGYSVTRDGADATTRDPWGTQLRLVDHALVADAR